MDCARFKGFWQRLAHTRLHAQDEMPVDTILARLLETWRTCVVCSLLRERTFYLVSDWQYALTQDAEAQACFVQAQTWCNRHAWIFTEMASPLTRVRLHQWLHSRAETRMDGLLREDLGCVAGRPADQILQDLTGNRSCPLCEDEAAFLEILQRDLACGLTAGWLRPSYLASAGCCLPHLATLLEMASDEDTARFLLVHAQDQLRRLSKDLKTYELETESRRREYGSTADAPHRAMVCWVGMRGMISGSDEERRAAALCGETD